MSGGRLLVHDGTFAALGAGGDVTGGAGRTPDGLFVRDARHLSRWRLTLDGAPPVVLVPAAAEGERAVLTPEGTRDEPPACAVFRYQALYAGRLSERLRVTSNVPHQLSVTVGIEADADFADQFQLRSDRRAYDRPGVRSAEERSDGLVLAYRRGKWQARTTVTAAPAPTAVQAVDGGTARILTWRLVLPAHGSAEISLAVTAHAPGAGPVPDGPGDPEAVAARVLHEQRVLTAEPLPSPARGEGALARACAQGLADLARLMVPATGPDGEQVRVPGAGVPWFLTLFGRDSLLTSLFALPYRPRPAEAVLRALAATQARETEPERVAEPGKIVHEVRYGELAHFGQVPYGRYYGSVDSTPLFLVLLGAHWEQTGDPALARRLEGHARAAVDWMYRYGGLDDHGYLVYTSDEHGLRNQNWKDSAGAVCFRDGTQATGTIAVAEAQGYAYDALRRTARLARSVWQDPAWAARLEASAAELAERFTEDFWLDVYGFPALALDGAGLRVDAPASDAGHLLWSGILAPDLGRRVGRRLLQSDFFSGWGVRTLAAGVPAHHPLSYHRGSIWPHDNAVIALGLSRYGLHDEAATLAHGLLDAAGHFGHRLPEVIAGYDRADTGDSGPVPYPHANSPQAWAAATPLALLTAVRAGRPEA